MWSCDNQWSGLKHDKCLIHSHTCCPVIFLTINTRLFIWKYHSWCKIIYCVLILQLELIRVRDLRRIEYSASSRELVAVTKSLMPRQIPNSLLFIYLTKHCTFILPIGLFYNKMCSFLINKMSNVVENYLFLSK